MVNVKCMIAPKIADHNALLCTLNLQAPTFEIHKREVWLYNDTEWEGLSAALGAHDWSVISSLDAHAAVRKVTEVILDIAKTYVPQKVITERKSTHPWANNRVMHFVAAKRAAEGTLLEQQKRDECSAVILEEYGKYIVQERDKLQSLPRGAKRW